MSTSRKLEAIVFDVDGTLAETERDGHRVAFNAAFSDFGLDWVWSVEQYGRLLSVTGGKERIRRFIAEDRPEMLGDTGLDAMVRRLHQRKTEHYVRLVEAGEIELRPGVLRLLRSAKEAGVRLAIATTTTLENVSALLRAVEAEPEVAHWFEEIAAGDVVSAKKPAPDIYELVLANMGLAADDCVAIEDSANGLRSARAAGIKSVVVTPSVYTAEEDFSDAALVVDCLGDDRRAAHLCSGEPWSKQVVSLDLLDRLSSGHHVC